MILHCHYIIVILFFALVIRRSQHTCRSRKGTKLHASKTEYILNAQFGSRKNIYLWWFGRRSEKTGAPGNYDARKTALHEDVDHHFLRLILFLFLLRREFCRLVHFVYSTNILNDKIYDTQIFIRLKQTCLCKSRFTLVQRYLRERTKQHAFSFNICGRTCSNLTLSKFFSFLPSLLLFIVASSTRVSYQRLAF